MGCILPTMHYRSQHCCELLHPFAHHCQHTRNNSQHCWRNNVGSCCVRLHTTANIHATTLNTVGATMLGVVASVCTPLPTYTQQLSTLLAQQCWELLRPFARSLTTDFKSVLVLEVFVPLKGTPAWRLQQSLINLGTTFF